MSVKTTAQIAAEILVNVSDALTKQNTAAKLRQVLDDLNDSMFSGKTYEASLSLTSAQILTLYSVPVEIVAAPGAGKYIEVISASCKVTFVSAAYTGGAQLLLTTNGQSYQINETRALLSTATRTLRFTSLASLNSTSLEQCAENAALNVSVLTSEPAGGDNTIVVKVLYRIVTI